MYNFFSVVIVDKNGNVCISILHEPGDDRFGYEKASERWLPVHTVETILISVISMLADPNDESPANVDAAVCYLFFSLILYFKIKKKHLPQHYTERMATKLSKFQKESCSMRKEKSRNGLIT